MTMPGVPGQPQSGTALPRNAGEPVPDDRPTDGAGPAGTTEPAAGVTPDEARGFEVRASPPASPPPPAARAGSSGAPTERIRGLTPAPAAGQTSGRLRAAAAARAAGGQAGVPPAAAGYTRSTAQQRPARAAAPTAPSATHGRTRHARLRVARVDPWSVMKVSFLLSIAAGIVLVVAAFMIWSVLDSMGVFTSVGSTVRDVTGTDQEEGFDLVAFLSLSRVIGFTTLLAIVNVVLITAISTLGTFLYNIAASFAGGIDITLSDGD